MNTPASLKQPRFLKRTTLFGSVLSLLVCFLSVPSAMAETQRVPQPTQPVKSSFDYNFAFQHDSGVVATLDLGLGYGSILKQVKGGESKKFQKIVNGVALLYLASVGWTVVPNFSLEASSFGMVAADDGMLATGLTARYWFNQSPWSIALSFGPSTFKVSSENQNYFSNLYLAMQFNIGLSSWLTDHTYGSVKLAGGASGIGLSKNIGISAWWLGGVFSFGFN